MVRVKVTAEMAEQAIRETNWAAIDALTDEDIDRQIAENPDAAPILSDQEFAAMRVRTVRRKLKLTQAQFAQRFRVRSARCATGSRDGASQTRRPWRCCASSSASPPRRCGRWRGILRSR
jgi:DNA-binding transcriptional regulator YiaG